jgi:hypothetical protein
MAALVHSSQLAMLELQALQVRPMGSEPTVW